MTSRVVVLPSARTDIRQIWRYTARRWNAAQAETYIAGINAAIRRLAEGPRASAGCDRIRPGYVRERAGSHYVFAFNRPDELIVVRVLHERMNFATRLKNAPSS